MPSKSVELKLKIDIQTAQNIGIHLLKTDTQQTTINYHLLDHKISSDRTRSGNIDFHKDFLSKETAKLWLHDHKLELHIFIDHSLIEVFAYNGLLVFSE